MIQRIYKTIRLFTTARKEPYRTFYQMLGFCPNNISLFQQACRHRSASHSSGQKGDNERLEFLGDAILSAVVSDIIYQTYHSKREGFLSKTRSKIVKRETLDLIAIKLGLDRLVETAPHTPTHNNHTYGNALEALIGAIYIDQGFDKCRKIVEGRIIKQNIDINQLVQQEANYKSRLIEWCQHYHLPSQFEVDSITNDEHNNPIFHAHVIIVDTTLGEGNGYTKKEAQQEAAHQAYTQIKKRKHLATELIEKLNQTSEEKDSSEGSSVE